MPEALTYFSNQPRIHEDPDGTLQIDVPPVGVRRALGIRSQSQFIVATVGATLGALSPPLGFALMSQTEPATGALIFPVLLLEVLIAIGVSMLLRHVGKQSIHISATASQLAIVLSGSGDTTRYTVPRDQIESLTAEFVSDNEGGGAFYLVLRRKKYDSGDHFLKGLPEAEICKIAQLLQTKLQLTAQSLPQTPAAAPT
jgi:hypothetical protein